ncbi:signal peptidase I [Secundilactobacillus odoratitofui DSM 19909 = JCM 15043]|uniref:Signal peptidase I n=1 Tax=Secundilactobacillus odoratitofui DSM 19909 = JCM 15043 TaxID=1423776 RepID=A0A0R1M2I1_9LACO|nr:signal peptidase I [Secundilactobacillus odoratitofui]KRK98642.1 signal peptidase I [Secundilactobacillus odoratitofui DSM 19909 = JCM 15043]
MKKAMSWIIPIAVGLALAIIIRMFWLVPVGVSGASMEPNLKNGQRIVAVKTSPIKRFSVIVFDAQGVDSNAAPKENYVKRVIGLPGDSIRYTKTGKLYVNGKYQAQNFISKYEQKAGTVSGYSNGFTLVSAARQNDWSNKWSLAIGNNKINKVPKGCYFVMGDHRSVSEDGRVYGFVPKSKVVGVVKVGFWNSKAKIINHYTN